MGGVAIFVKSTLAFHPLPNFCQDFLQSCAISVTVKNTPLSIAAIYSPPKQNVSNTNSQSTLTQFKITLL